MVSSLDSWALCYWYCLCYSPYGLKAHHQSHDGQGRFVSSSMIMDIHGEMATNCLFQVIHLSDFLMEMQLNPNIENVVICKWNAEQTSTTLRIVCLWKDQRHSLVPMLYGNVGHPLNATKFAQLELQHRLWTSDHHVRRGLQDHTSLCFLCDHEEDNFEHILIKCVFARQVWL